MCVNCCEGICQSKCVAGQARGYRGPIIPSEAILYGPIDLESQSVSAKRSCVVVLHDVNPCEATEGKDYIKEAECNHCESTNYFSECDLNTTGHACSHCAAKITVFSRT